MADVNTTPICHQAPAQIVEHCARMVTKRASAAPTTMAPDAQDLAGLVTWLAERDEFDSHDQWVSIGMALKLALGDAGRDVWALAHDDTVDDATENAKWESFASEPGANSVTINSWLKRAHAIGWKGTIRPSTASMFGSAGTVAALATAAGATLAEPLPMLAGQQVLAEIGAPILAEFLDATKDAPNAPMASDYPTLPEAGAGHGLHALLKDAIARTLAMAEQPKSWKAGRVVDAMALLQLVNIDVHEAVRRRASATGVTWPDRKIKLAAGAIAERVERHFVTQDDWVRDHKGDIEHNNSDNVRVFLALLGCEVRWNAWLERAEIKGHDWPVWSYYDDTVHAKLLDRASRTKTRFLPADRFFWNAILAIAHSNAFDPVLSRLQELQAAYDGTTRLDTWLTKVCGVPDDAYHRAVGRSIIGGMVRRARQPGCKHDTMPVFFGKQGTGKSTMTKMLAVSGDWFSDEVMLGDASKELVLSLAGKLVIEIGEMGMRGSANPNHVKAMLSRERDRGRTAYARSVSERPRRNIFIGTTNDDEPLVDASGNRRFLPVEVASELDLAWLAANICQLVGEAAVAESAGADFALPRSVWDEAALRQEEARAESDTETLFNDWFAQTEHTAVSYILASDLVHLMQLSGLRGAGNNAIRGAVMKRLGFRKETTGGKRIWARGADVRPCDILKGTRYVVGQDAQHRPTVNIRAGQGALPESSGVQLPPLPPLPT